MQRIRKKNCNGYDVSVFDGSASVENDDFFDEDNGHNEDGNDNNSGNRNNNSNSNSNNNNNNNNNGDDTSETVNALDFLLEDQPTQTQRFQPTQPTLNNNNNSKQTLEEDEEEEIYNPINIVIHNNSNNSNNNKKSKLDEYDLQYEDFDNDGGGGDDYDYEADDQQANSKEKRNKKTAAKSKRSTRKKKEKKSNLDFIVGVIDESAINSVSTDTGKRTRRATGRSIRLVDEDEDQKQQQQSIVSRTRLQRQKEEKEKEKEKEKQRKIKEKEKKNKKNSNNNNNETKKVTSRKNGRLILNEDEEEYDDDMVLDYEEEEEEDKEENEEERVEEQESEDESDSMDIKQNETKNSDDEELSNLWVGGKVAEINDLSYYRGIKLNGIDYYVDFTIEADDLIANRYASGPSMIFKLSALWQSNDDQIPYAELTVINRFISRNSNNNTSQSSQNNFRSKPRPPVSRSRDISLDQCVVPTKEVIIRKISNLGGVRHCTVEPLSVYRTREYFPRNAYYCDDSNDRLLSYKGPKRRAYDSITLVSPPASQVNASGSTSLEYDIFIPINNNKQLIKKLNSNTTTSQEVEQDSSDELNTTWGGGGGDDSYEDSDPFPTSDEENDRDNQLDSDCQVNSDDDNDNDNDQLLLLDNGGGPAKKESRKRLRKIMPEDIYAKEDSLDLGGIDKSIKLKDRDRKRVKSAMSDLKDSRKQRATQQKKQKKELLQQQKQQLQISDKMDSDIIVLDEDDNNNDNYSNSSGSSLHLPSPMLASNLNLGDSHTTDGVNSGNKKSKSGSKKVKVTSKPTLDFSGGSSEDERRGAYQKVELTEEDKEVIKNSKLNWELSGFANPQKMSVRRATLQFEGPSLATQMMDDAIKQLAREQHANRKQTKIHSFFNKTNKSPLQQELDDHQAHRASQPTHFIRQIFDVDNDTFFIPKDKKDKEKEKDKDKQQKNVFSGGSSSGSSGSNSGKVEQDEPYFKKVNELTFLLPNGEVAPKSQSTNISPTKKKLSGAGVLLGGSQRRVSSGYFVDNIVSDDEGDDYEYDDFVVNDEDASASENEQEEDAEEEEEEEEEFKLKTNTKNKNNKKNSERRGSRLIKKKNIDKSPINFDEFDITSKSSNNNKKSGPADIDLLDNEEEDRAANHQSTFLDRYLNETDSQIYQSQHQKVDEQPTNNIDLSDSDNIQKIKSINNYNSDGEQEQDEEQDDDDEEEEEEVDINYYRSLNKNLTPTKIKEQVKHQFSKKFTTKESFDILLQYIVSCILDKDFINSVFDSDDNYFLDAIEKIEMTVVGRKDTLVRSSVWQTGFFDDLQYRPQYSLLYNDDIKDSTEMRCQSCKRATHSVTAAIVLSGKSYEVGDFWKGYFCRPEKLQINLTEPKQKMYHLGSHCFKKTSLFHELHHYPFTLYNTIKKQVRKYQHINPDSSIPDILDHFISDDHWTNSLFLQLESLLQSADELGLLK
ncbi:hypothetical protein PPL_04353 [Heterostelium album PN500]|uniref:DUF4211 domain-containing protein n=1 Tax=Heterostelium pallidum (strain ATCC 26659 / Pp 5 / PN500) TaxID=670386 RepID=D3B7B6_HETP5|nr:hypothetical protein PPL_04353 [Heterostelium album PN500]EFA82659.1 hypothetical protein PPL_04353 [Heterostelium album PN500]|eukprot:XP_020434776.1 hypothetical protein PPL_04353 [Heterostelium album PN500]